MTDVTTEDSPEDVAYRAQARAWLAENGAEYKGRGPISDEERPAHSKAWTHKKWLAGYSGIDVPKAAGGVGGTRRQATIFAEEEQAYDVPRTSAHALAIAAYTHFGSPEQIKRWGEVMWSGAGTWTQLFSEPSAGSDLAALRTRAVKQGDHYVVNGQKVWSSFAHEADYGFLIARTDGSVPKHKGLSFFFIDMRQPGVTVRPIRQMSGASDFNEVFFTDAVVPERDRIGAEGQGWEVAMRVLSAERTDAGTAGMRDGESPVSTANLIRAARNARRGERTALDSAAVRAKLAQWFVEEQGARNFGRRMQEQIGQGQPPSAAMPIMKITSANRNQLAYAFLMDMEEYAGLIQDEDWPGADKFYDYLYSSIWRIAGGADEILRNQLAERALGMPQDIRLDKDVAFDKLPG